MLVRAALPNSKDAQFSCAGQMLREESPLMPEKSTHEQRLAAKLRENLRRRKEQARARASAAATAGKPPSDSEQSLAEPDRVALKPAADSDS
jgi:hypothetical protein